MLNLSRRIITALLAAVPKRDPRKVLMGIHVTSDKDGTTLETTDGRLLIQIHVPTPSDEGKRKKKRKAQVPDGIYSHDGWRVASRAMSAAMGARVELRKVGPPLNVEEPVELVIDPGQSVKLKAIEGKYADVSSVTPEGEPKFRIGFNVKYLAQMAKAMEPFVETKHHSIILEIWDANKPTIWRTGDNINTDDAYQDEQDVRVMGLLMPVRIDDITVEAKDGG